MRHKEAKFPLDMFMMSVVIIAGIICVFACVLAYYAPEFLEQMGNYIAVLLVTSIGGALLLTAFITKYGGANSKVQEAQKTRINELEKAIDDLQDMSNRREEFVASFAHELKTPLTAIIGYADMLRSRDMSPKSRFTAAGYIFSEGKRLESLSLKLMDIIVAGKQEIQKKRFDAAYWLREIAAVTVPSITDNGMKLEVFWENGEVEIEPDLFKTLLINLIDNARKASHKGQSIELSGKNENGGYSFYVRDYGRGMKNEDLSKIIEPFYMIDKSRSRQQNGAGLGLALCQKIAELHGTALEYESEPGKGTTVRIHLQGGGKS